MSSNSSKYYGENGIHRVPLWRIGGFALNNTATNLYLFLMNYVAYYLGGFAGVATVTASSFAMMMRIWDGVTDPFIGFVVDKTNGKFGKNRPFMVIGNVILLVMSFIMYHVTHLLPENNALRFGFFIVIAAVYYVGYTFQCVVTKSAQSDQRPQAAAFVCRIRRYLQYFPVDWVCDFSGKAAGKAYHAGSGRYPYHGLLS